MKAVFSALFSTLLFLAPCASYAEEISDRINGLVRAGACQQAYKVLMEARDHERVPQALYQLNKQILVTTLACGAYLDFALFYDASFNFQIKNAPQNDIPDLHALNLYRAYLGRVGGEEGLQNSLLSTKVLVKNKNFAFEYLIDFVFSQVQISELKPKVIKHLQNSGSDPRQELASYQIDSFKAKNRQLNKFFELDWNDALAQVIAMAYLDSALNTRPLFRAHFQRVIRNLISDNKIEAALQHFTVSNALNFIHLTLDTTDLPKADRLKLFKLADKLIKEWYQYKNDDVNSRIYFHILGVVLSELRESILEIEERRAKVKLVLEIIQKQKLNYGIEMYGFSRLGALSSILDVEDKSTLISMMRSSRIRYENEKWGTLSLQPLISVYAAIEARFLNDIDSEIRALNQINDRFPDISDMTLSVWGEISLDSVADQVTSYFTRRSYELNGDSEYLGNRLLVTNRGALKPISIARALGYGIGQITNDKYPSNKIISWRRNIEELNSISARLLYAKLSSMDEGFFVIKNSDNLRKARFLAEEISILSMEAFKLNGANPPEIILTPNLDKWKNMLNDDEVVVLHQEDELGRWVQFISKSGIKTNLIDPVGESINGAEMLRKKIVSSLTKSQVKLNAELFTKAIDPNNELLKYKNIIFIGDGDIFDVPVNFLWNQRDGGWLVSTHDISNFYNFPHFLVSKVGYSDRRKAALVGFANPIYSISSLENSAFIENLIRAKLPGTEGLTPLPETEIELEALAQVHGKTSTKFTESEATYTNLSRLNFNEVGLFTLSTHGVLAGEVDGLLEPSVALTPESTHSGFVTATELFLVRGTPQAAFLLTCNSSTITNDLDSVEIQAIADAFAAKGTTYILSSMWAVDSLGTTKMVELMSQGLKAGFSYTRAHQAAMRQMIRSADFDHPAIWGAFNSMGDEKSLAVLN